jgi:topoisomerase IV subunit A
MHVEKFNPKKVVSVGYVDGESKQYMVKRFLIETSTMEKEFGFISEGIGSRMVVVSTAESPEVEVEIQKAKDKPKKIQKFNLDELVDVKGWKAIGNKLSEFKVTKINLVQDEETGLEEGDEDNELIEVTESEDSQSPKKKEEPDHNQGLGEGEQASLFLSPEKPKQQQQEKPEPRPKIKVEQQSLFGESQHQNQESQNQQKRENQQNENQQNEESQQKEGEIQEVNHETSSTEDKKDKGKSFGVGETIEFEL